MTSHTLTTLQQRFRALSNKDQLALTILGIFLSALLIIYLLVLPANRFANEASEQHLQRAELLAWMQANETAARALSAQNTSRPSPPPGQSILSLASQSAKGHGITFKRFEPFAEDGLRIWLDDVAFNSLLLWLTQAQGEYGIEVQQASIDQGKSSGQVNAKLELLLP